MALALYVNADGNLEQINVGDTLNVDNIDVAGTGHLTIGASLGTGDELHLGVAGTPGDGDVRVLGDLRVDNDLYVTGSSVISVDETVTGTFSVNGDVNLGDNTGANTINLGGGSNDSVYLLGDALIVGNNTRGIGTSATDALDELWLSTVVGGAGTGVNLRATGNGTSGSEAIGAYIGGFTNISPATGDLQTVLESIDTAIGLTSATLQDAYESGNTISVSTTYGSVLLSNSTDATDVLEVIRTYAGAGAGIDVQMGPGNQAVTGYGVSITSGTGATNSMLFIDNYGSGNALDVYDGGNQVFYISQTGSLHAAPISGGINLGGGGNITMSPSGYIWMSAATGAISMTVNGANSITMTNGGTPTGTLLQLNNTGTGPALDVQDGGTSVFNVTGQGAVNFQPTSGQTFAVAAAGAGSINIGYPGAGALYISSTVVSLSNSAGELYLDDIGSWGGTLSQSGDRVLTQTGAGEILNGATSIIGAINRLADTIQDDGVEQFVSYPIESSVVLAAGNCVARGATAGRVQLADADGTAEQKKFVGICRTGGTGDAGGTVVATVWTPGALCTGSGFTAGSALFVPDTPGNPTVTAPSTTGDLMQRVGWALSTTQYILDPGPSVIL